MVLVSDQAHGNAGFDESFMAYHGKAIRPAIRAEWRPAPEHLDWHRKEVFKGDARNQQAG